jgi:hypothetical protein
MPPSTATTEISFSVLKRVKTYLPATMGQERLLVLGIAKYSQRHSAHIECSRRQV